MEIRGAQFYPPRPDRRFPRGLPHISSDGDCFRIDFPGRPFASRIAPTVAALARFEQFEAAVRVAGQTR